MSHLAACQQDLEVYNSYQRRFVSDCGRSKNSAKVNKPALANAVAGFFMPVNYIDGYNDIDNRV